MKNPPEVLFPAMGRAEVGEEDGISSSPVSPSVALLPSQHATGLPRVKYNAKHRLNKERRTSFVQRPESTIPYGTYPNKYNKTSLPAIQKELKYPNFEMFNLFN